MANGKPDRVVVIGAGIIGGSIACHLAEQGARVTVLDRGKPGSGATHASFAWINAREKNPRAYHELNRRSMDMWPRFAERLDNADAVPVWGGELRWASEKKRTKRIQTRVKRLQSWGYDIRELSASQISDMEPGIRTEYCTLGSWSAADGHVDATAVTKSCLALVKKHSGTVLQDTEVTDFRKHRGSISAVVAGGNELECETVVLACGPDSPEVGKLAGIHVPTYWNNEATLLTTPVEPIFNITSVLMTPHEDGPAVFVRQLRDGRVMTNLARGDAPNQSSGPTEEQLVSSLNKAAQFLPSLEGAQVDEIRRVQKPIPQDGRSILGFVDTVSNLYLASTHSGVTLAPIIGEMAAIEILNKVDVHLLKPFRHGRFPNTSG
jgi:glycine/D-amino acid oxidase-like deaminating enzyme